MDLLNSLHHAVKEAKQMPKTGAEQEAYSTLELFLSHSLDKIEVVANRRGYILAYKRSNANKEREASDACISVVIKFNGSYISVCSSDTVASTLTTFDHDFGGGR